MKKWSRSSAIRDSRLYLNHHRGPTVGLREMLILFRCKLRSHVRWNQVLMLFWTKLKKDLAIEELQRKEKNETDVFVFLHVNYVSTVSCNLSLKLVVRIHIASQHTSLSSSDISVFTKNHFLAHFSCELAFARYSCLFRAPRIQFCAHTRARLSYSGFLSPVQLSPKDPTRTRSQDPSHLGPFVRKTGSRDPTRTRSQDPSHPGPFVRKTGLEILRAHVRRIPFTLGPSRVERDHSTWYLAPSRQPSMAPESAADFPLQVCRFCFFPKNVEHL